MLLLGHTCKTTTHSHVTRMRIIHCRGIGMGGWIVDLLAGLEDHHIHASICL